MSGVGAADTTLNPEDYKGFKLAIVAASWHTQVMDGLIDGAQRAARDAGIEPTLVRVPGTFELPVAATRLAEKFDAIVALGVVIRGGTPPLRLRLPGRNQRPDRRVRADRPPHRLRRAHLRQRAAGTRPRRSGRLQRRQGLRGDRSGTADRSNPQAVQQLTRLNGTRLSFTKRTIGSSP